MNDRYVVAVFAYLLLVLQLSAADAASTGPYDGEWKGTATSTGERCRRGVPVTITVEGRVVLGQAKFDGDPPINGAVDDAGGVGATIGFQFLKGQFKGDEFEGTFTFSDCQWEAVLKRSGGVAEHTRGITSGMSRY
jgi:phosphate-selective porin